MPMYKLRRKEKVRCRRRDSEMRREPRKRIWTVGNRNGGWRRAANGYARYKKKIKERERERA